MVEGIKLVAFEKTKFECQQISSFFALSEFLAYHGFKQQKTIGCQCKSSSNLSIHIIMEEILFAILENIEFEQSVQSLKNASPIDLAYKNFVHHKKPKNDGIVVFERCRLRY